MYRRSYLLWAPVIAEREGLCAVGRDGCTLERSSSQHEHKALNTVAVRLLIAVLPGTIVNRTYGIHKTYIFNHFY